MKYYTRHLGKLAILFVFLLSSSCYDETQYCGTGQLIDNGPFAATDRYILDLGEIHFNEKFSLTFELCNLPQEEFVFGMALQSSREHAITKDSLNTFPNVRLTLSGEDKNILFDAYGRLDRWTWSVPAGEKIAFVYRRHEPGTYFNATSEENYTLTFNVIDPSQNKLPFSTRLQAKSAGWK